MGKEGEQEREGDGGGVQARLVTKAADCLRKITKSRKMRWSNEPQNFHMLKRLQGGREWSSGASEVNWQTYLGLGLRLSPASAAAPD